MSKQVLSAAIDAAATEAEWDALLTAIEDDPALKDAWSQHWEWRDARDGVAVKARGDFSAGVMAAIAAEPMAEMPNPKVVPLRAKAVSPPVASAQRWRTLVPLSAAAGVVAAVLFVGGLRGPSAPEAPVIATAAVATATTPVNWTAGSNANPSQADAAKAAILNAYLMEHSNTLAERGMGSTLANARFAARTADYRPDAP